MGARAEGKTKSRKATKQRHLTTRRTSVALAERGVQAEAGAQEQLKTAYRRFLDENEPARQNEAGKELIRAIFGKDSTTEDPAL